MLCPSCLTQKHSDHVKIQFSKQPNKRDIQVVSFRVSSGQNVLGAFQQMLQENKRKLADRTQASLAALDVEKNRLIKYIDDLKLKVQRKSSGEHEKLDRVEAQIFECSELGREALEKITSDSDLVSASGLKTFEMFTKFGAEFGQMDTGCVYLTPQVRMGGVVDLKEIPVGNSILDVRVSQYSLLLPRKP